MTTPVLLLEDDPLNRRLVCELLSAMEVDVLDATGVDEAWEKLQALEPDAPAPIVGLLDIQTPGGGGLALLERIRATPRLADMRLVALTAYAMPGDESRFLEAGFDDYMSKPIDTRAFMTALRSWLDPGNRGGA